jgi:hypothetical protein
MKPTKAHQIATNVEIIAIHFLLNAPTMDMRSIFALPKR